MLFLLKQGRTLQISSRNDQFHIPLSQRNMNYRPKMTSSDPKSCTKGNKLSFHNIFYQVEMKSSFLLSQKTVEKEILSNIRYVFNLSKCVLCWPTMNHVGFPYFQLCVVSLCVHVCVQIHRHIISFIWLVLEWCDGIIFFIIDLLKIVIYIYIKRWMEERMQYLYIVECGVLLCCKNKLESFIGKQMHLETIVLSKINQTCKLK